MEKKNVSSRNRKELGFQRSRRDNTTSPSSSSSANWGSRKETHQQEEENPSPDPAADAPTFIVGTCPDMCPAKERIQRERLRDLSVFERLNGNPGKTSPSLAVKKFCRTISTHNMHASDLRPSLVLQNTLKYLLNLVESSEYPFEVVHDFVFDRTRSIRQDLSMQNIADSGAIYMYEEMVRSVETTYKKCSNYFSLVLRLFLGDDEDEECGLFMQLLALFDEAFSEDLSHCSTFLFVCVYVCKFVNTSGSESIGVHGHNMLMAN